MENKQTKNEAEARKQQYILEGEGEAKAIRLKAEVGRYVGR